MKGVNLGEFEELVLLAVCIAAEAYGVTVKKALEAHARRFPTLGAVHATLYRLQDKGYLASHLAGATERRGGRRKRLFTVTSAGLEALREARAVRETMWTLMPGLDTPTGPL